MSFMLNTDADKLAPNSTALVLTGCKLVCMLVVGSVGVNKDPGAADLLGIARCSHIRVSRKTFCFVLLVPAGTEGSTNFRGSDVFLSVWSPGRP